jgi:hypothetical protein
VIGLLFLASCGSSGGPYSIEVMGRDALGNFNALTTNDGSEQGNPTCTVRAFDAFGNRIGFDIFKLGSIAAGETLPWNGHVPVDELVARYEGECE